MRLILYRLALLLAAAGALLALAIRLNPAPSAARAVPATSIGARNAQARAALPAVIPPSARSDATAAPDFSDRAGDGTPGFLRLDDAADRDAFRAWFTLLAEAQAMRPTESVAAEISDCAALLRFAYREALREHTGEWASTLALPALPRVPNVAKYAYPRTPLGAALFRVQPGPFLSDDLLNGAFAQFADARTLMTLNTHFVTRDIQRAQPGDLLFFRQLEQNLPFHAMVYLGPSQLEPRVHRWVVYHTGPVGEWPGEIRRVTVDELFAHPSPRWRPLPGNGNFLGVYRWNILRTADE